MTTSKQHETEEERFIREYLEKLAQEVKEDLINK